MTDEECCNEHLQLKQWLLENIELKKLNVSLVDELQLNNSAKDKEIEELINENTELKMQVAMFQKKEREQVTKILMDEYKR